MSLNGKKVQILTVGSWSISGIVIDSNDKMIIIEEEGGTNSIIWRDKIAIARILGENSKALASSSHIGELKSKEPERLDDEPFPSNSLNYSNTFFGIPKNLLKGAGVEEESKDNEFSVFFAKDENKTSGINFRSSDDSTD